MIGLKKPTNPLTLVLLLSGAFFVIFLVISAFLFSSSSRSSKGGGAIFNQGTVGIVELNGVILDSKKVLARLERFENDSQIKAIVLRINSPGGAVAPSQEIHEAIKKFKKPVVASMGSVAASGGYYIACGAKKIFANAGTITGSIGVIMEFANLEKLYEWAKVHRYVIKTGKFKDAGAEYREMTPEERALLQGMVDDVLVQFKQAVSEGRKLPMATVTEVADGRIFSGAQAKTLKLVDELGSIQDAIADAGKMAGIKGKPRVAYPERNRKRLLDYLMDDNHEEDSETETPALGASGVARILQGLLGGASSGAPVSEFLGMRPGVYWLWTGSR